MIVVRTIEDITYSLDLEESIDWWINKRGFYEWGTYFTINKYVKEGMVSLDVGANIGCYALQMAKLIGEKGKVVAFEPMNYSFQKMKRNIELNPSFQQIITAEKMAVSNTNERKLADFTDSFPVNGKTKKKQIDNNDEKLTFDEYVEKNAIIFTTLDKYTKKHGIDKIDFMKIDVDGYELKVLQGAIETLMNSHPVMNVEFGKPYLRKYGDNLEELVDFLASLEYGFYTPIKEKKMSKAEVLEYCPEGATRNIVCRIGDEINEVKT